MTLDSRKHQDRQAATPAGQNMERLDQTAELPAMASSSTFVTWPRYTPVVVGLLTAVVALGVVWIIDRSAASHYREEVRADTVRELSAVRGAAEIAINKRVHLTLGLKAHVSINPEMTASEFADLAALMMKEVDGIRSVTSIRDNVINDVYPREGNEGAIGLELLKNPVQKVAAEYAIGTGRPWLAGPIKLVQGGEAFINRAPVYITEPGGTPGDGAYWGMVSILIEKQTLVSEIMASVPDHLSIAVRGRTDLSEPGNIFLGDADIESAGPIMTEISLPTGSWQLYGVPESGWPTDSPHSATIRIVGLLLAVFFSTLVYSVARLLLQYRNYSHELELANERVHVAHLAAEESRKNAAGKAAELEESVAQLKESQIATLNMLEDIEEAQSNLRESKDALEQSNVELQQFAYVASHDLQTPLRAVAGFAQLLEDHLEGKLDEDGTQYIETIVNGCQRMQTMIRDLLTFSRVESRSVPFQPVNLVDVCKDAIAILSASIKETKGRVTYSDLPTVTGDQSQLSQLLMNLIANGLKYHGDQPPHVHIDAQQNGTGWIIGVSDNGIGIDKKYHGRIFDIFGRLHTQEEYPGTGIGLAVCRRIVKRHHGDLWLESKAGKGTTFYFNVPGIRIESLAATTDK